MMVARHAWPLRVMGDVGSDVSAIGIQLDLIAHDAIVKPALPESAGWSHRGRQARCRGLERANHGAQRRRRIWPEGAFTFIRTRVYPRRPATGLTYPKPGRLHESVREMICGAFDEQDRVEVI